MNIESQFTPLLSRFVATMNAHDSAAFITCFAPDAVVEDEGRTHRGIAEIQSWINNAFAKFQPVLEVTDVAHTPSGAVLSGPVSGNFEGSPLVLHYHLAIEQDRITTLRCVA